ncbi:MAG: MerR family transcriptional regulator [Chloroflexota bacterium]
MNDTYKVGDLAELFDVSRETIRRWASEFEVFLSTNANPDTGLTRYFTVDDVEVFSLVNEVKDSGGTYDDAHLRLRNGERGSFPQKPLDRDEQTMVLSQMNQQLKKVTQERDQLQRRVGELEDELLASKEEIARLKGRAELSDDKLPEAQKRIEELLMKIAVLEYQLKQGD